MTSFVRISKGALVNPTYVDSVHPISSTRMEIQLKGGQVLAVSRRRIGTVSLQLKPHALN
ncbi:LytTR family DNA-binding domain-containing protein [Larkinella soli]|uniref:LytTR family DNA-binding domain-containing protein n=1 Tax=Larkinella soli TaxID=1770527 RepID=UPI000FFB81D7|nr:LytTR family DNA-binding domain-containing protein [Larkinella soli]